MEKGRRAQRGSTSYCLFGAPQIHDGTKRYELLVGHKEFAQICGFSVPTAKRLLGLLVRWGILQEGNIYYICPRGTVYTLCASLPPQIMLPAAPLKPTGPMFDHQLVVKWSGAMKRGGQFNGRKRGEKALLFIAALATGGPLKLAQIVACTGMCFLAKKS